MVINVFKEKGWTSFDVVAKIRGILKRQQMVGEKKIKVGHAGTLDPLAKGVLIILTEKDTKKQREFMQLEKEYVAEIMFGATSPTYDLEGELTYQEIPENFDLKKRLETVLDNYGGEIKQRVPAYSAVKTEGKRLYKQARKGNILQKNLPVRTVFIKKIEVINYLQQENLPAVSLKIVCSKGTYIRSIAHDLGEDLGVGAVLTNLVRTRIGDYTADDALRVSEVAEQLKV